MMTVSVMMWNRDPSPTTKNFVKRQMANSMAPGGMSNDGVIDTANTVLPQAGEITLDTADKTALDAAIAEVEKLDASSIRWTAGSKWRAR